MLLLSEGNAGAQSYSFSTLAGVGCGAADGTNSGARFFYPEGGALDAAGNLYVADSGNHTIRKIAPGGIVSTIAGLAGSSGSADGLGTNARFNSPGGVTLDAATNLYVVDTANHTVRRVTPGGTVSTIAGKAGYCGSTDATNNLARFFQPRGITVDSATNLYVTDTGNHTVRKLQFNALSNVWIASTIAGIAGSNGSTDGAGALFSFPSAVATDISSNLYIADTGNFAIRLVTPQGVVSTLAGAAGQPGGIDGTNPAARFVAPTGLCLDAAGNLYVTDSGSFTIRKISTNHQVSTLAGHLGFTGSADALGANAFFNYPCGIACDAAGANLYIADTGNNVIRRLDSSNQVVTIAGLAAGLSGSSEGTNSSARFLGLEGVAVDPAGNVYAADTGNNTIRKISPAGVTSTLAGFAGSSGSSNGVGTAARFFRPIGLALDAATNLYVADSGNHTIRVVTPGGSVSTVAGTAGVAGYLDGTNTPTLFASPTGIAVDAGTNIYVADFANALIRKITPGGVVTTLAGIYRVVGSTNGTNGVARFSMPFAVAVDAATNIYVADTGNHTVRLIAPAGSVSTLAGSPPHPGFGDGVSNAAGFYSPHGIAVDSATNIYIADTFGCTIRRIAPGGAVATVAGFGGSTGAADDTGPRAQFWYPFGLAVDAASNLFVADTFNNSIRKGVPYSAPVITGDLTNQTALGGSSVMLSAGAAGPGLSYQWQLNGVNIAGATNSTLSFSTVSPLNAGVYDLVISNSFGAVISQHATLTVLGPPNDLFANPTVLAGTNFTAFGTNVGATREANEPFVADNIGGHSVWWTWTPSNDANVTLSTAGSSFDTILGVYRGNSISSLTPIAADDDFTDLTSYVVFGAKAGRSYRFNVDGYNGASGSIQLNLSTSAPMPPAFTANPLPQSDISGADVAFGAMATGSPPIKYQWRKNGSNISGATNATLNLFGITTNSVGNYDVVASDEIGSTNSVAASLSLTNGLTFYTLAGTPGYGSADGLGPAARFHVPNDVALDLSGNVYVADGQNNTIRKITPAGLVSTFAGYPGVSGIANGLGTNARLYAPAGIAVDPFGNIIVADSGNNLIRRISPLGQVDTIAGAGGAGAYSDGTNGTAHFDGPSGMASDLAGNIYVADAFNHVIRMVTPSGVVTTVAGIPGVPGHANGTVSNATFYSPEGVDIDPLGNLYVADTFNHTIRKISTNGSVVTFAGTPNQPGTNDGFGGNALFNHPEGIGLDAQGNILVADTGNNSLRKISSNGVVSTLVGLSGFPGSADGTNSNARLNGLSGVAVDSLGYIYVADDNNNTIRKITPSGLASTLAGTAGSGTVDGVDGDSRFNYPSGVVADAAGNLYVSDFNNATIRKVSPGGIVTTFVGLAGSPGSIDGTNQGARLSNPSGLAIDSATNLYLADSGNHAIRKITPAGVVTTVAGLLNNSGSTDGVGTNARFDMPMAIAIDSQTNLYVADTGNSTIRKITPNRTVSTIAGLAGFFFSYDGVGTNAYFAGPSGIAVDNGGNVFVSDTQNYTIRKIATDGTVTTIAGSVGNSGLMDGTGPNALFGYPFGITLDPSGNLLVSDLLANTLRLVSPQGMVRTVAGAPGFPGSSDGNGTAATFFSPQFVALDADTNLYVSDSGNYSLRTSLPPPPSLQISFVGSFAVLSWPTLTPGYIVESSSAALHNSAWTVLTNPPILTVGTNYVISNVVAYPSTFYRLHKQ